MMPLMEQIPEKANSHQDTSHDENEGFVVKKDNKF
jgi:hypothetical protein